MPPPVPQPATVHSGVPKFVETSAHLGFGEPASKLGSASRFVQLTTGGVLVGVGVRVGVGVAVADTADVAVGVAVALPAT